MSQMNKKIIIITSLVTSLVLATSPTYSQVSTDSASPSGQLDLDTIKENVKRRIQEVVNLNDTSQNTLKPTAYMGVLTSIANFTLTIETNEGISLASTSAETNYISLPDNDSIEYEDLSLENYVVALGYLDDALVLDTKRVIIEDEVLSDPATSSLYGLTIPSEDNDILIQNPLDNTQFTCEFTRSTVIESIDNDTRVEIEEEDILPLTPTMIVYEPDEDEPDTLYCRAILQHSSAPVPNITLDANASQSANTPPELQ